MTPTIFHSPLRSRILEVELAPVKCLVTLDCVHLDRWYRMRSWQSGTVNFSAAVVYTIVGTKFALLIVTA